MQASPEHMRRVACMGWFENRWALQKVLSEVNIGCLHMPATNQHGAPGLGSNNVSKVDSSPFSPPLGLCGSFISG